ncbi:MAG: dual specificity protein phosphatase family protein [Anaerolineales bacterium]
MDISQITDYLFVGAQPSVEHAEELRALGVRLIISMRGEKRPPGRFLQPPFRTLWLPTYDTFLTPIPLRTLITGVETALPEIDGGGRVLIHCQRGRHRSVAMAAAILIARGHTSEAAMQLILARRPEADPYLWYIRQRIVMFEKRWRDVMRVAPHGDASQPKGQSR